MRSCFKVAVFMLAGLFVFSCNEDKPDVPDTTISVETLDARDITPYSAVLCGTVTPASSLSGKEVGFIISRSGNPSLENGTKLLATEIGKDGSFSVKADGLAMSSYYNFRACLFNKDTPTVGNIKVLKTSFELLAVDIGLSVKWANADLGAQDFSAFGDQFAWGETSPKNMKTEDLRTKDDYVKWFSNKWWKGEVKKDNTYNTYTFELSAILKYNTNSAFGEVDNKTQLDPEDDAAHVILGGNWRMPTAGEIDELVSTFDNPNYKWIERANGSYGFEITYLVNGNKVFFVDYLYWSSSLNNNSTGNAFDINLTTDGPGAFRGTLGRHVPMSIRPVCD